MTLHSILDNHTTLRKSGSRYIGKCPKCGGSDRTDKFVCNTAREFFHCYGCGFNGGLVTALRELEGMSCPEAHREAGIECDNTTCPVWEGCGKGKDEKAGGKRKDHTTPKAPARRPSTPEHHPTPALTPAELWQEKALKFVDECHAQLLDTRDQLAYLAGRGLDLQAVQEYRLGWNPKDYYRHRTAWGLPEDINETTGKPKKLWIPRGIVIPSFAAGHLDRIRVRRTNEDLDAERQRTPDREPLRYFAVPGSGNDIAVIGDPAARAVAVVESDLDGYLLHHLAGDVVAVIPLTTASARPREIACRTLDGAVIILVALDSDPFKINQRTGFPEAAGANNWLWWKKHYSQSVRWPVPDGKDPGEAYASGVDLRAWILAGLPISLHPKRQKQPAAEAPVVGSTDQTVRTITLDQGEIYVCCREVARQLWINEPIKRGRIWLHEEFALMLTADPELVDKTFRMKLDNPRLILDSVVIGRL